MVREKYSNVLEFANEFADTETVALAEMWVNGDMSDSLQRLFLNSIEYYCDEYGYTQELNNNGNYEYVKVVK